MLSFITPTFIIAVLIALSFHEWAHGFVANRLGDPTAKYAGRLTLNPLAHLDPIGSLLFLLVGFGWGKPVPVDPRYFHNFKRDTALVSLAGPASNLILAFGAFFLMLLLGLSPSSIMSDTVITQFGAQLLNDLIMINLVLMAFNLLPIAPLDGSKIIRMWVPVGYEYRYEEFVRRGPWILLVLIVAGQAFNVPILSTWISLIMSPFLHLMDAIATLL